MIKYIYAIVFLLVLSASIPFVAIFAIAPTPTPVEYVLPYPGILPTHPLYVFKKLRDAIIEMLISDPVKKAEFYMLQADKKLNMATFLFDKKNPTAAIEQLAQSQSMRTLAVVQLETLGTDGNAVLPYVSEKLSLSIQKHIEVETEYKREVESLQALLARCQKLLQRDSIKVINN